MMQTPRILPALIWLLCGAPALLCAEDMVTEIIELHFRTADEVRDLIKPLVPRPGSVGALRNQLIIRTTTQNLMELKRILAKIDFMPRQLLITVKKAGSQTAIEQSGGISGSVAGRDVRVTVPSRRTGQEASIDGHSGDDRVGARVRDSQTVGTDNNVQSVQVLEGNTAFIQIGQSAPLVTRTVVQTPQGARSVESTNFATAQRGFRAKPRIHGDNVSIEISSSDDRLSAARAGSIESEHLQTVVSGRLGEWIEMGGIDQSSEHSESGVAYRSRDVASDQRRLMIKVEEIK